MQDGWFLALVQDGSGHKGEGVWGVPDGLAGRVWDPSGHSTGDNPS